MTHPAVADIASTFGLSETELYHQALVSFLLEKKRQVLQQQREILSRYGSPSISDLESRIAQGLVEEHPAWEDLIVLENLTVRLDELNVFHNGNEHDVIESVISNNPEQAIREFLAFVQQKLLSER